MTPIIMPQIGQDSPSGQIVQWLKKEHERVARGEVVLTVESEKAVFEVPADRAGVLLKILHPAGAQVPILHPVAYIGDPGETADFSSQIADASSGTPPARAEPPSTIAPPLEATRSQPPAPAVAFASPAVRRLARERGVDLATVRGTGPGGRITLADVETANPPS
jgi:pyruvate dehydrogenase E2 component (dihydrolipoamide acetyltransferase)